MRFRSWIVASLVIGVAQAILSLLLILQHDALYSELLRQRVAVIAQTTAETFRPIIDLGLPISMLRDGDAILARGTAIDPGIIAIHAINPTGIIAHSTGPKPAQVSDDLLAAMRFAESDFWGLETQEVIYSGFSIRRAEDAPLSGAVVVEYPLDPLDAASRNIARITIRTAVLVLIVASALAFLLIYAGLDRPRRKLIALRGALAAGQTGAAPAAPAKSGEPGRLDAQIEQLGQTLRDAEVVYRKAQRALAAPDDAGGLSFNGPATEAASGATPRGGLLSAAIVARILPITAVLIVGSALVLGSVVIRAVNSSIEPELAARTDLIGTVVSENVQRALDSGIGLDEMVGGDRFFGDMLERLPEVAYIAIATGRIVIEAGERIDPYLAPPRERRDVRSHPILHDGEEVAYVVIDIDPRFITKRFRDAFLDAAVILLVSMLLAYEAMLLLIGRTLAGGLEQVQRLSVMQAAGDFSRRVAVRGQGAVQTILRTLSDRADTLHGSLAAALSSASERERARLQRVAARLGLSPGGARPLETYSFTDIRLALFLFAAADELPLAFLPLYTRSAENLWPWLDQSILIALPLAGYLAAIVVMSPYARVLVERVGVRGLFVAASIPTLIAHIGLFAASTAQEIILWRTVTGFGYALVTLAAQDYVLSVASRSERDRMLGVFTLVLFGGVFSGVALGGVLADRLGPANVFLASAALIAASALLSQWLIAPDVGRRGAVGAARGGARWWVALGDMRLLALVLGIAIPGAVILQAFVSYLVALTLDAQGASAAEIGRVLMLFFLTTMAASPLAGRMIERQWVRSETLVLVAAALLGLSLLPVVAAPSQLTVALAMVGTGAGSAMIRGTQVSLALALAETDLADMGPAAVLGALRTGERLGSIVGLILMAGLAGVAGYAVTTLAIALWVLVGAGLYAGVRMIRHERRPVT